jgi:fibronectin type 3 domain-containing protein
VAGGWNHTLALKVDGGLWAWGGNWYGELGDNTTMARLNPVQVFGFEPEIAAGPTSLSATAVSTSRINLSWRGESDNESMFRIDRKIDSGQWVRIALVKNNVTAYADTGLERSVTYAYRLRAINDAGKSDLSKVAKAITAAPAAREACGESHFRDTDSAELARQEL